MKLIKKEESLADEQQLKELMKQKEIYDAAAKAITDKIRKIVYKYDNAKVDFRR
jgi:hypothetical protein